MEYTELEYTKMLRNGPFTFVNVKFPQNNEQLNVYNAFLEKHLVQSTT